MNVLRLKELLKEKGISGKHLADSVNVSENTISFISTGKTQPRFELLLQIAEMLDVDVRDLFNPTKDVSIEKQLYIKNDKGEFEKFGVLKLD